MRDYIVVPIATLYYFNGNYGNSFFLMIHYQFNNYFLIYMNKKKFNKKKYIIKKLFYILLMAVILYYPLKIAKYYLFDFSYQEIFEFAWRFDRCVSYSGQPKSECLCDHGTLEPNSWNNDEISLDSRYLLWPQQRSIQKVVLISKPSFFSGKDLLTGGEMTMIDLESRDVCYYNSVNL